VGSAPLRHGREIINALIRDGFSLHNQRADRTSATVTRTVAE
jgi:hypothetical protein